MQQSPSSSSNNTNSNSNKNKNKRKGGRRTGSRNRIVQQYYETKKQHLETYGNQPVLVDSEQWLSALHKQSSSWTHFVKQVYQTTHLYSVTLDKQTYYPLLSIPTAATATATTWPYEEFILPLTSGSSFHQNNQQQQQQPKFQYNIEHDHRNDLRRLLCTELFMQPTRTVMVAVADSNSKITMETFDHPFYRSIHFWNAHQCPIPYPEGEDRFSLPLDWYPAAQVDLPATLDSIVDALYRIRSHKTDKKYSAFACASTLHLKRPHLSEEQVKQEPYAHLDVLLYFSHVSCITIVNE